MKNALLLLFTTLGLLCSDSLFAARIDFAFHAYDGNSRVKDVEYSAYRDGSLLDTYVAPKGIFEFSLDDDSPGLRIVAKKSGYVTKEIIIDPENLGFEMEYDYQELYLAIVPERKGLEKLHSGVILYNPYVQSYTIEKYDTTLQVTQRQLAETEVRLNKAFKAATDQAELAASRGEYGTAIELLQVAMIIEPKQESVKNKINMYETKRQEAKAEAEAMADSEASNPEVQESSGVMHYLVQIGAFRKAFDTTYFDPVPDVTMKQFEDLTRVYSGDYLTRMEAVEHRQRLIDAGYEDCFIVVME